MRIFPDLLLVVPASFKLAQIGRFSMLHLLPCLTTFNFVGYINGRVLNKSCGVSSICNGVAYCAPLNLQYCLCPLPCHASLNRTCIILDCASCHDYACVFTMLFPPFRCCFFVLVPVTLRLRGSVLLSLFVFFMNLFFFLVGSQAR